MDGRILALRALPRIRSSAQTARRAMPSHCHFESEGGWPGYVAPPIDPARLIKQKPMHIVFFPAAGAVDRYLFFWVDPRPQGCPCKVVEGADIDETALNAGEWRAGAPQTYVLARSKRMPKKFKVFRSELDVPASR